MADKQIEGREGAARLSADGAEAANAHGRSAVTLVEPFLVWLRVAALSFGGPAGQIAVMHRIGVDERKCCCRDRRRSSSRPISAGS